jgi:pimeloyl-ACP methyl ester carboxylesterase
LAALLQPVARRLVYPGASTRLAADRTDLELRVDGVSLRGWEVNAGRERALVYYGGNGEGLDWLVPELSRRFPDHTSYLVAYRGYGASEGTPGERVLTSDALAVFDHAAARHPGGVDVVGRSLGSGVAVQVAVRRPVERLVLITPFDSLVATAADLFPWLPVRSCLEPPTYPMQAMIAVFDFPEWSHGDDGALVPALEVDWIGGTDQATP